MYEVEAEAEYNGPMARIAIIGCGPRGLAVLERLTAFAEERGVQDLCIEVIEEYAPGSGAVWNPEQSPLMLMNTASGEVTAFVDETVELSGPLCTGPTLYEWAHSAAAEPWLALAGEWAQQEAARLAAADPASRPLYGLYLQWRFSQLDGAGVRVHTRRARRVHRFGEGWQIDFADEAESIRVDACVLTLGHIPALLPPDVRQLDEALAQLGITNTLHIHPANAADHLAELETLEPRETVLIKGVGLSFFDYMAALTEGRGGRFTAAGYEPSGREPHIVAGSPSGLPYRGKRNLLQQYTPQVLTPEAIADLTPPIDFMRDIWPLITAEVEAHYPDVDWQKIIDPAVDMGQWRQWLHTYLTEDASWFDPIRDTWPVIEQAVGAGRLSAHSYSAHFKDFFTGVNSANLQGPPQFRLAQLDALIDAGIVTLPGPGFYVEPSAPEGFVGYSRMNATQRYHSRVCIEARQPNPDVSVSADPLMQQLLAEDLAMEMVLEDASGTAATGALAISEETMRVIHPANGQPWASLYAFGISVAGLHWPVAETAQARSNHGILRRADAIAADIAARFMA